MTMPIDLVLVRHGKSEGNEANRKSRKGDNSAFTDEFRARPSSNWRLTSKGVKQAKASGEWIRNNFPRFDRHYTSEYTRAMETAAHLDLPYSAWFADFNLREREWGDLDVMTDEERQEKFSECMKKKKDDGFYWKPPGGESMADLCLRVDRVLATLHRECSDKRVIIVCHSETIWAFRIRLERITQERFNYLQNGFDPDEYTKYYYNHNGQIVHYTRCDVGPERDTLYSSFHKVRIVYPYNMSKTPGSWRYITRPRYSSANLLSMAEKYPRMVDDE